MKRKKRKLNTIEGTVESQKESKKTKKDKTVEIKN